MRKLLPLIFISLIWFGIGWFLHGILKSGFDLDRLSPAQQRVLKAQKILQERQFLLHTIEPQTERAEIYAEAAIAGMLTWSQDRHGDMVGPLATSRYQQGDKELNGITGLQFDIIEHQMVVVHMQPGSPAEAAGIEVGDILQSVDGVAIDQFIGAPEVVMLLQGPVGSTYELTVQRGDASLTKTITRKERTYLSYHLIDNRFIFFKTAYFSPQKTLVLFEQMLKELSGTEIQGFIWDLRDNGGGYPAVAEELLGYFREPGTLLYTVEFKDGTQQEIQAKGDGRFSDLPIVLLIDETTWSTGEIVAAAMAPGASSYLVGMSTAGKGIIQDTVSLDQSHLLHFTIAKWLTPNGEWIQYTGVQPDIRRVDDPATETDEILITALAHLEIEK